MRKMILIVFVCALSLKTQAQTSFQSLGYVDVLTLAKKENKHVFIDFYTDWCAPCKRMAKDVFPQKEVGDYLNARYICLQLNAEKEGKELAVKFGVKAYPTFVVTDTQGKCMFRIVGGMDADRFINSLHENSDPEYSPVRITERYLAGERAPRVVEHYTSVLMRNGKYKEGKEVVENYFNSLSDEQRMRKENLFIYLRYTLDWDSPQAQFFIGHLKDFDQSSKDRINRHFSFLYRNKAKHYFLATVLKNEEPDKKQYQQWKRTTLLLPEEERKAYEPIFRLIKVRIAGNLKKFIEASVKEFDRLDVYQQEVLTENIDKLIEHENHLSLKRTAKYIRKRLNELPPKTVVFSCKFLEKTEALLYRSS